MLRNTLFVVCLLGCTRLAAAENLTAPVTDVVLYPGSATIVRTIQVLPGAAKVTIPGLPENFDLDTFRADADPGIRIGDIAIGSGDVDRTVITAAAETRAKIEDLTDQVAALDAEIKASEIVKTYLERLGGGSQTEEKRAAIDGKTLAGVIDVLGRGANDALGRIQKLAVRKRKIDDEIQALQRELDLREVSGSRRFNSRTLTVSFIAERAGRLKLSYQSPSAGWRPTYRAELDSSASTVDLLRLATVAQKTGEDWNNVHMTLSTILPRSALAAPDPHPWLLSYNPPRPAGERVSNMAMSMAPPAPAMFSRTDGMDAPYQPPTFQTQTTFATEFEVPTRVTLPSDGREVSLSLAKETLPVKQVLRIVPRLDKAALVTAIAERPQGVWLPGNMQLFRDRGYVGAASWNPDAGEGFMFSFGRDDLVRVAVEPVKGDSGTAGLFDRKSVRRISDMITVASAHKKPIDIEVLESSPVSTSDEIEVQAEFDPKPSQMAWMDRRGVVAWQRALAPKETARFRVVYNVQYPKEGSVSGLK